MQLVYFAWVREIIGCSEEQVAPPSKVTTVDGLLDWLTSRGDAYRAALANRDRIRVAVNQTYVDDAHPVAPDDEVAIFPPVTGG